MAGETITASEWLARIRQAARKEVTIEHEDESIVFWIRKLTPSEFLRVFKGLFANTGALEEKDPNVVDVEAFRSKENNKGDDWIGQLEMLREVVWLCTLEKSETHPYHWMAFFDEGSIGEVPLAVIAKLGKEILDFSGFNKQEAELSKSFRDEAESS